MPIIHILQQTRQEVGTQRSRIDEKAVELKWQDVTLLNVEDLLRASRLDFAHLIYLEP